MNFHAWNRILIVVGVIAILTGCSTDDDAPRTSKVVLSVSDKIVELNELQYQVAVGVQVAELDGAPIPDAKVSLSMKATGYYKGFYRLGDTSDPPDGKDDEWVQQLVATCAAEDTNNNGELDIGEDTNNNSLLEPKIPSITANNDETPTLIPGTQHLITDDNGFGYFSITYPKSESTWVDVEIKASVSGGLAENRAFEEFKLPVLKEEVEEIDIGHAFQTSPYGRSAVCANAL